MRLIFLLLATACTIAMPPPYYTWMKDPNRQPCKSYVWKQMPRQSMPGLCADSQSAATERTSCTIGCLILSPYSEGEAEWVFDRDGTSVADHERRHALKGDIHVPR